MSAFNFRGKRQIVSCIIPENSAVLAYHWVLHRWWCGPKLPRGCAFGLGPGLRISGTPLLPVAPKRKRTLYQGLSMLLQKRERE